MKILFTILSFFLGISLIQAQLILDKNDFLKKGDTVGISIARSFTVDYNSTGEDYTWDFSELESQSQDAEIGRSISNGGMVLGIQFGSFAPPKYKSDYFVDYDGLPIDQLANFLPGGFSIEGMNRMIKIEDEQITYPGYSISFSGQQVGARSNPIEKGFVFPLTYGDSYISQSRTPFSFAPFFNQFELVQNRKTTSKVDGYGTLITPYGTFKVVRVHHEIKESDSVRVDLGFFNQWMPINRTIHEYEWWSNDMKRPILRIDTEGIIGSSQVVRKVTYLNNAILSTSENEKISAKVYPNPSSHAIYVEAKENIENIKLYNTLGETMIEELGVNHNKITLDVSSLQSGVYFLHIQNKKGTIQETIIVE